MIGEQRCKKILETATQSSVVDECEAFLSTNQLSLTRFANNTIHQNVSHSDAQLFIRSVIGKRQGRSTTNDLSLSGIVKCRESARQNANFMPEDPDFLGLPEPSASSKVSAYDESTAFSDPETRANIVKRITTKSERNKLVSAGFCRTGINERAVMTTKGTWAHHVGSIAGLLITSMTSSSAGWAKGSSWRISDLKVEELINQAANKAISGQGPTTCQPGEYTVILSNYAVDDVISALNFYGMGAQMVQDGRSWMNGLQGQQAMSPMISIWDDGHDLNGCPAPFDCEGVPRKKINVVTNGIIGDPVYNSYTAGKEGRLSTGHQLSPGYTGDSEKWLTENIDLKSYSDDKSILIRFQYVTDDAINGSGLCIRDMQVSGDNNLVRNDLEVTVNGFHDIDNLVPQEFIVQVIKEGRQNEVISLPLDENNIGQIVLDSYEITDKLVVAIASLAPKTLASASYRLVVD